ncbi:hypothetical protein [Azospirillum sp. sgz301742]
MAEASPRGRRRRRAPTITEERIAAIVEIIRNWEGRLTWDTLCSAVEHQTGARYTRQALDKHTQIKVAFQAYRVRPSPPMGGRKISQAEQRILVLQRQVHELEKLRDTLLERFARWAYNASTRDLDEAFLDQPLRPIDRAGTR